MSRATIAERYARAILELGIETSQLSQLTEQVQRIAEVYAGSEELRSVLDMPLLAEDKRRAVLQDVARQLGLSPHATNAVRLLASRHRLALLPEIARQLRRLADQKAGIARVTVASAQPLSEPYVKRLTAALEKATRQKVLLERTQDPSLIAGVVARVGDYTIDSTLSGRLAAIEKRLLGTA